MKHSELKSLITMLIILIGARCQTHFAAPQDCLSALLLRTTSDSFYRRCSTLLMTGCICVRRDVGDSPHLHKAKIRLTLAMRTSSKTSRFIRVKTSRINVRRTDLGNRRPLGANRLPGFSTTYYQQKTDATAVRRMCLPRGF